MDQAQNNGFAPTHSGVANDLNEWVHVGDPRGFQKHMRKGWWWWWWWWGGRWRPPPVLLQLEPLLLRGIQSSQQSGKVAVGRAADAPCTKIKDLVVVDCEGRSGCHVRCFQAPRIGVPV
mgnify:CR=1 FL=1